MKRPLRHLLNLPHALARRPAGTGAGALRPAKLVAVFLAVILTLSALGGYQLSRLTHRVTEDTLQRTDQLLLVEESLDAAALTLGRQVQEWKDMLLRANRNGLYAAHRKAFIESSVGVQKALLQTKAAMRAAGMETDEIDRVSGEHKTLLAKYVVAHVKLDPQDRESSRLVDEQVIGMDRDLQQHLATLKADVERRAKLQLTGAAPPPGDQYLLLGLLGAASLFAMALIGFAFATRLQGENSHANSD